MRLAGDGIFCRVIFAATSGGFARGRRVHAVGGRRMRERFGGTVRLDRGGHAGPGLLPIIAGCAVTLACSVITPPDPVDGGTPPPGSLHPIPQVCIGSQPAPTVGSACGCDADCDTGQICMDELNHGEARGSCLEPCDAVRPCPDGFRCREATPGDPATRICLRSCATSADCRQGYVCGDFFKTGELFCVGLCTSDADCPVRGVCDPYSGMCGQTPQPGPGEVGDPCSRDADCKSDICVVDQGIPGGYCTAYCSTAVPIPGGCPTGSSCEARFGATGDLGACLRNCSDSSDCRPGYLCRRSALHNSARVCWP